MRNLIPCLLAIVGLLAVTLGGAVNARAQERSTDKRIVIELKDGKTLVDGEEVEADAEGRVIIKRRGDDGQEEIIIRSLGDDDGPTVFFSGEGNRFELRSDGEGHTWFSDDGEGPRRFWMGDGPDVFRDEHKMQDLMERARGLQERAQVMTPPGRRFEVLRDGLAGNLFFDGDAHDQAFGFLQFSGENDEYRDELRRLEEEIREVARDARRAEADERNELEETLDELLEEALGLKQQMHQSEIERMERRLDELRSRYEARESEKREVIERRKRELLGERDPLDW